MPQAESDHTRIPSRRTVIKRGGAVAALVGMGDAGGAVAASPDDPDAALLAAFRRWIAQERTIEAASTTIADDDAFAEICRPAAGIEREVARMPAKTALGLAIKSYLVLWAAHDGGCDADIFAVRPEVMEPMECSLLADAMTFLQGALA